MSHPTLSVEYMFKTQKYLNILSILSMYHGKNRRITIDHLRYKLLNKPNLKKIDKEEMKTFFSSKPNFEEERESLRGQLNNKEITIDEYNRELTKLLSIDVIETIGIFSDTKKVTHDDNLRKYIRHLKKFRLVEMKTRKVGKPYYELSSKGVYKFGKYILQKMVDDLLPEGSKLIPEFMGLILLNHIKREAIKIQKLMI